MSALVATENSNPDHIHVVIHQVTTTGPFVFAVGGTMSQSPNGVSMDVLQCLSVVDTPAPPPPTGALACPSGRGTGTAGLRIPAGMTTSYSVSNTSAKQANTTVLNWGAGYSNANRASSSYTGSLRATLWAVSSNFTGSGKISGTRIATVYPNFTGTGSKSSNQLFNGYSVTGIQSTTSGSNPAAGSYCMVLALDEYETDTSVCNSGDHYCYSDWVQFPNAATFK